MEVSPVEANCCSGAEPLLNGQKYTIERFNTNEPCFRTAVHLVKDEVYDIEVEVTSDWRDDTFHFSRAGLKKKDEKNLALLSPFKRSRQDDWFSFIGVISCDSTQAFRIGSGIKGLVAETTGPFYLFVNPGLISSPTRRKL